MPKYDGVCRDTKRAWYFKIWLGRDPLTGRQVQVTKRGYATASDASRGRSKELDESELRSSAPSLPAALSVKICLTCSSMASTPTSGSRPRPGSITASTQGHTCAPGSGRSVSAISRLNDRHVATQADG